MAAEKPTPSGDEPPPKSGKTPPPRSPRNRPAPMGWILVLLFLLVMLAFAPQLGGSRAEVRLSFFRTEMLQGNVKDITIQGNRLTGTFIDPPVLPPAEYSEAAADEGEAPNDEPETPEGEQPTDQADQPTDKELVEAGGERLPAEFYVDLPENDAFVNQLINEMLERDIEVNTQNPVPWGTLFGFIWLLLLIGLGVLMFSFMRRARDQMMGGGMLGGVTKSPARRYDAEGAGKVTFDDVAGLKGVKKDLKEIVQFLRDPEKFQRLGAAVPKGVLLNGPPGTGKTMLAKAVAGEAGVPFFSISGSEFIQLFVGVGASRVRDMFKTAKRNAPSILFIDEIDAIGRQRGAGLGGGHDEREQTLNQILSEMDGFSPSESVIVVAATNRPDVLDPALLRPGRFDRHITVDRPSIDGRRQLFEVHTRHIPLAEDVDFDKLARATVGLTGADIRNLANEAALWATRHDKQLVDMDDFEYARDKVLMGSGREDVLTEGEKKVTAFHEAGHTIVAWRLPGGAVVHKVTIIPRGRALGVTQLVPEEDRHNMGQQEMQARLAMLMAGRISEKIVFDEYSAGAENDLQEATKLARRMVTHWGMSDRLGPVAYHNGEENPFLGREMAQHERHYSEHTAQMIDEEVAKILHNAADRARTVLTEGREDLNTLAKALLEKEELDEDEIERLIGPQAIDKKSSPTPAIDVSPPTPAPSPSRGAD